MLTAVRSGVTAALLRSTLLALVLPLAVCGCVIHTGKKGPALRPRAAYDFGCPEAQVTVTRIDDRTQGASGCGKKATYIYSCHRANCTWVMNTDVQPTQPPPADTEPAPSAPPSAAPPPAQEPEPPPTPEPEAPGPMPT